MALGFGWFFPPPEIARRTPATAISKGSAPPAVRRGAGLRNRLPRAERQRAARGPRLGRRVVGTGIAQFHARAAAIRIRGPSPVAEISDDGAARIFCEQRRAVARRAEKVVRPQGVAGVARAGEINGVAAADPWSAVASVSATPLSSARGDSRFIAAYPARRTFRRRRGADASRRTPRRLVLRIHPTGLCKSSKKVKAARFPNRAAFGVWMAGPRQETCRSTRRAQAAKKFIRKSSPRLQSATCGIPGAHSSSCGAAD